MTKVVPLQSNAAKEFMDEINCPVKVPIEERSNVLQNQRKIFRNYDMDISDSAWFQELDKHLSDNKSVSQLK
jgi:hypothetical protein